MTIERIKTYVLFAALLFSVQAWSQRGEMDSLSKKAQTCYQNHDFVNAIIYQQQVVGLLREQERPIGLRFANANRSLALYVSKNGGSDAAITTIQSAIKIYDSIFTPCNEESLASRLELVLYLEKSCKYQEGLNIIREIDEIENCMEVVPEKYSIDALLKAASLYSIMSDYNKSLDICKEALIRSKNSFGENSEQYAQSLDLMSYIYTIKEVICIKHYY